MKRINSELEKELLSLISQGEGYNIEFKESYNSNLAKEICSMSNATGGKILIGVTDEGKIKTTKINNKIKSEVQTLVRNFDPSFNVIIEEVSGVLIINVPEGNEKPYSTSGKFYLRQGANSQQLSRNEIRDFFIQEGLVLFDDQSTSDFDFKKDIKNSSFDNFIRMAKISRKIPRYNLLENLSLIRNNKPKNASVLLFSQNITKFFLQATINCVFFRGKDRYTILDRKEFTSDLNSNYENAFNFVQSKLNTEYIIGGGARREVLEIPDEALREAILNAIVHRDYFIKGANIQINIYSDRVEIINPGGLVKGMTLENLGKKSLSRNNLLFGLMQRMDLVEKSGSGFLRIRRALKKYRLADPIIETDKNWFTITFLRPDLQKESMQERLSRKENVEKATQKTTQETTQKTTQKILELLIKNPQISRKEIARNLGSITEDGIKYNLTKLKKEGRIKRIGPDKGGYWEILSI